MRTRTRASASWSSSRGRPPRRRCLRNPALPPALRPRPLSDQLSDIKRLHDQGMLTDEEFSAAKAKVLGI